jgi:YggT family protein
VLDVAGAGVAGVGVGLAALAGLVQLVRLFIYMVIVALLVLMLLSWVNPHSLLGPLLDLLLRPFLRPIRSRLKPLSGFDLSPLVLLILCQLALILVVGGLTRLMLNLF